MISLPQCPLSSPSTVLESLLRPTTTQKNEYKTFFVIVCSRMTKFWPISWERRKEVAYRWDPAIYFVLERQMCLLPVVLVGPCTSHQELHLQPWEDDRGQLSDATSLWSQMTGIPASLLLVANYNPNQ